MLITKDVWGKPFWFAIHVAAASYPNCPTAEQRRKKQQFYRSMVDGIPCGECAYHYLQMFEDSFDASSRYNLFKWTVDIHNRVNIRLGKPVMDLKDAMELYNVPNEECNHPIGAEYSQKLLLMSAILALIFIAVIVFVLFKKSSSRIKNN